MMRGHPHSVNDKVRELIPSALLLSLHDSHNRSIEEMTSIVQDTRLGPLVLLG